MSRKITYELKTNFKYSEVTIEVKTSDGELLTPDDLADILGSALDDYSELDLGSEVH